MVDTWMCSLEAAVTPCERCCWEVGSRSWLRQSPPRAGRRSDAWRRVSADRLLPGPRQLLTRRLTARRGWAECSLRALPTRAEPLIPLQDTSEPPESREPKKHSSHGGDFIGGHPAPASLTGCQLAGRRGDLAFTAAAVLRPGGVTSRPRLPGASAHWSAPGARRHGRL